MIAYHASHEQFSPRELLRFAKLAERAGFEAIHSSDHFHPWSERQGQSGFSFAWLGAAMQATHVPFGMICAPGPRYHPTLIAQACGTLQQMFPRRLWVTLGSGEALNEVITGSSWPDKQTRNERLLEAASIIRRLFTGEEVSHEGHFVTHKAKLYSLPGTPPALLGAALSPETAALHGRWADGLLTTGHDPAAVGKIVQAFRDNGGAGKPIYLKFQLSYARDKAVAEDEAYDQWRNNVLPREMLATLQYVSDFDVAGQAVTREDLRQRLPISDDPAFFLARINEYQNVGCDHIILHNVNRRQEEFMKDFGHVVLKANLQVT
ncbi:TIGR03885 family FMN-dependent LLM class oxidoreductase [Parachryseolinea silvisoli]|uniref:TIGR03885 family FMN-dependent LLM class oxidoreductase n=1 Tax=Parachryseolinea silvisoli TaxID=2873601 RepID=UPI002265E6CF|nr:TIGR03885 family FMN-dependent LLM class oxidoreductase [Parachryseolinea silvisoli]MCD9014121.1 TIGR03885 family FMN-dependent LLM class oxidoreductase [Parachryseolinea silvisoli]